MRKIGVPVTRSGQSRATGDRADHGRRLGRREEASEHQATAMVEASARDRARKEIAGHVREAAASDIEFAHGRFVIAGHGYGDRNHGSGAK